MLGCVHVSAGIGGSRRHQIPVAGVRGGWEPPDVGVGSLSKWFVSLTMELAGTSVLFCVVFDFMKYCLS